MGISECQQIFILVRVIGNDSKNTYLPEGRNNKEYFRILVVSLTVNRGKVQ